MHKHFLNAAIRTILSQPFFSFINVFGLAIGIACFLLIIRFIQYEVSYDRHFPKADRIYRMTTDFKMGQRQDKFAFSPPPLAKTLEQDFPEIERAGRLRQRAARLIRPEGDTENIKAEHVVLADQGFIEIFDFDIIAGRLEGALSQPNSVIISQSLADLLFPNRKAVNQTVLINNADRYKITAVFKDTPENSHFDFDVYLSLESFEASKENTWISYQFTTYFLLKEGSDIGQFEEKIPQLMNTYVEPQFRSFYDKGFAELAVNGDRVIYDVTPLSAIHTQTGLLFNFKPPFDQRYLWLFSVIAIFIILIACINFTNLSTAKSSIRAKEVGIRKVLGSFRYQLITQFLLESYILTIASSILGLCIALLSIPYFREISGRPIDIPLGDPFFYLFGCGFILLLGVISGIYSAFFLSGFDIVNALKGRTLTNNEGSWFRSSLVVFQFAISIILIAATIAIYQQMTFIQQKKIGFEKEGVIVILDTHTLGSNLVNFKDALSKIPEVQSASISSHIPVDGFSRKNVSHWPEGNNTQASRIYLQNWLVDHEYINTLGLEAIAGRAFSEEFPTDSQAIVLNRAAANSFGFSDPASAIGEQIACHGDEEDEKGEPLPISYQVIGVVEDFHFQTFHNAVVPLCLKLGERNRAMSVKIQTENVSSVLSKLEHTWKQYIHNQSFVYTFLDQEFAKMYESEEKLGKVFWIFSMLAIIIACLGLFALAAFMAERRKKEIGIRKVLGASVPNIVGLLSKDFMILVLIATLIASPIAYYFIDRWLEGFAYKTNISPVIFIIAGFTAAIIAYLTISYQSFKAANIQPADTLKNE